MAVYLVFTLLLLVECTPLPVSDDCPSGETTPNGDCCRQCPAGWGVQTRCSAVNNTMCTECYSEITYSSEPSHTAGCRPCKRCARNQLLRRPCNVTHDTLCECRRNYFHTADGSCSQCTPCPPGFGAAVTCTTRQNSQCEVCANGTYSDSTSATKGCLLCSVCAEGTTVLKRCSEFADTLCTDKIKATTKIHQPSSPTPDPVVQSVSGRSPSIVPIYCSILAFVVLGLLAYVVFKKWSFRKIKLRAHAKLNRSPPGSPCKIDVQKAQSTTCSHTKPDTTPTCDSERTGDNTPLMAVPSTTLYRDLPTATRSDVESLLGISRLDRRDWRGLAQELGFTERDIMHFIKSSIDGDLPVHKLLTVWSDGEGAIVGVLVAALQRLNRQDVLHKLPVLA